MNSKHEFFIAVKNAMVKSYAHDLNIVGRLNNATTFGELGNIIHLSIETYNADSDDWGWESLVGLTKYMDQIS
jgi:hypothetical protein